MSQRELLTLVSAIMALMALGIDLMLPAFDDIREAYDLGAGSPETGKVITVFFLGLAVAQLVYGPLADRFGRKPVLYLGGAIYLVGAIGSALAPTFELLLLSRFVWGIGAAGSRVVATAIVRDRFEGAAMAAAMSQVMAVFMLVPVLAPTVGTGIIAVLPWRSVFWFCAVCAVLITLWSLRLRETLDPANRRPLSVGSTVRGYTEVARTRVTAGYTIATIFLQGVFTAYLASSELLIADVFDREAQFPIIFGLVATLFAAGAIVNGRVVERVGIHRLVNGVFMVLLPLTALSVLLSVVSNGHPNFWLYMPLLGLTLGSFLFLMPNLNTAALTPVGHLAGTASALSGAARMAGGAVLGTLVSSRVTDSTTGFSVGVALLCFGSWITVTVVRRRSPELATDHHDHDAPTRVAVVT
ncbi:multidrug effflux MFS transporter [Ilumatobacter nonamiensis]|uniref:multidrug effflux MFS transporter n=1 Tax=Ilumatobacter nonamiensis TaxID=467093 RepID=UPI000683ECC5|nr:multidrug effflux MFS transporter [Ilumatobacter nonamiensis]